MVSAAIAAGICPASNPYTADTVRGLPEPGRPDHIHHAPPVSASGQPGRRGGHVKGLS